MEKNFQQPRIVLPLASRVAFRSSPLSRLLPYLLLLVSLVPLQSCFLHYYKTNTVERTDAETIRQLINARKYFVLHAGNQNFGMSHVKVVDDRVEADVNLLPPEHMKYMHPANRTRNRFKTKYKDVVLYEVHLYTQLTAARGTRLSLSPSDIYQMDVYELNKGATNASTVMSIVGIGAATLGVVAIVATANDIYSWDSGTPNPPPSDNGTVETCSPTVYTSGEDGTRQLAGILYSGAIFAPLQRTDYLPLDRFRPDHNHFHLRVSGNGQEEVLLQKAQLLQVTHPEKYHILVDQAGKILSYQDPQLPVSILGDHDETLKEAVSARDDLYYPFTHRSSVGNASDIILNFKKPAGASSGKLLVSARNSSWAIYLFKKYKSLYGDYYGSLLQHKDKVERKKLLQCELDQSLPLKVSVKQGDTWKCVNYFYTPGNEVVRDMIMELDLSAFRADEDFQVRLETAFMFWDLDYAAMDFSEDIHLPSVYIEPANLATNSSSPAPCRDAAGNIVISGNDALQLDFEVSAASPAGMSNSYFLAGSGYYHDKTRYAGKPQLDKIAAFSRKGAFDAFSRETFDRFVSMLSDNRRPLSAIKR